MSALGFAAMRLPICNGDDALIDIEKTEKLIVSAYDQGITYFDTAYSYHGGNSERVFGSIVKTRGIRENIYIADKCPPWEIHVQEDFERILNEQLERLQTDYIDFYLLHAINSMYWEKIKNLGVIEFLENAKKQGKIRHIGFSFDDSFDVFKTIIDAYSGWECAQIQLNYVDSAYQAGLAGLEYAAKRGIGVVATEPLRGGLLAHPNAAVKKIFSSAAVPRIPSEWALRWLWEKQELSCVLSDMNSLDDIMINCAAASAARPNSLPRSQLAVVEQAAAWYTDHMETLSSDASSCTSCSY